MRVTSGISDRDESWLALSEAAPSAQELIEPLAPGQHFREVCHDMRQPVAGMLSLAGAALAVPELPSAARCRLEQIVTEAESLAELIERSLDCDDAAAGTPQTDLGQLTSEVVAGEQLTYQGLLRMTAPSRPVLADVNRVDARRIIANLLSNATRAAGPDGCVSVRVAREHDCAELVVQDSGPGFARIRPSTGLGTGVIARCLVRCGGRIDYGPSPAGGVKATVSLPLGCASRVAGSMRLILCDDHVLVAEALAAGLAGHGYEVVAVTGTPASAVAAVRAHEPDLCLLDLFFHGKQSGLDAARAISGLHSRTKVVVLSGVSDPDAVAEAVQLPVAGFIRKDQNVDEIARALDVIAAGGVLIAPALRHATASRRAKQRPPNPMDELTAREHEVVSRIVNGESTKHMAAAMNITSGTVRSYVKNVLVKLGVHSRLQVAVIGGRGDGSARTGEPDGPPIGQG